MEIKQEFIQFFIALGGFAGLFAVFQEIYKIYMNKKSYDVEKVLNRDWEIYKNLNMIMQSTSASKVLILYTHNGGERIQTGTPTYSSVSHEVNSHRMKVMADSWNKQFMDHGYAKMMSDLLKAENKKIFLFSKEIPSWGERIESRSFKVDGILKDVYESQGISHTIVCHIYTYDPAKNSYKFFKKIKDERAGKVWYMSIVFKELAQPTAKDLDTIRIVRNNISKLFKEQYKYS